MQAISANATSLTHGYVLYVVCTPNIGTAISNYPLTSLILSVVYSFAKPDLHAQMESLEHVTFDPGTFDPGTSVLVSCLARNNLRKIRLVTLGLILGLFYLRRSYLTVSNQIAACPITGVANWHPSACGDATW